MKKARMRRRGLTLGAMTVGIALMVSSGAGAAFGAQSDKSLTVGAKDFAGAQILSQVWGQALEAKGYDITVKDNIGPTEVIYPALENGDIDAYGEFQGTLLETQLGGTATADSKEVYAGVKAALKGTDIVASKPAPAVDVNGFYVTKATAKKYKLKTLSDLAKASDKLVFGGPQECETRDLCLGAKSQDLYGFQFQEVKKLDTGGPITTTALEDGDIDVGLLFTGSSVIPKGTVQLTDDKGLQPADNPIFLIRKDKATPALLKIVNAVSAKLTTEAYRDMALKVFNDKEDPADVAATFLKDNNFTK
jgi:osmoprotectant transport system substrate-binding protein